MRRHITAIALLGTLAFGTAAQADYEAGVSAYENRHYEAAFDYFLEEAQNDHLDAQVRLGHMYWRGEGTARNLVRAGMWLTVAYLSGRTELVGPLEELRGDMSEGQLVMAERMAIEWVVGEAPDTENLYQIQDQYGLPEEQL